MDSVYIVTEGHYSDYRIVAVFSTEKLANLFCEGMRPRDYNDYTVEEYVLDGGADYIGHGLFCYEVNMRDNGDSRGSSVHEGYKLVGQVDFYSPRDGWYDLKSYGGAGTKWARFYVLAHNKEHAVKVANEKRIQILATNSWGIDIQ